jgi:hypothetical protein
LQKKSTNIQFGGDKGKEVIERVYNFMQLNKMNSRCDDDKAIDQERNVESLTDDLAAKLNDSDFDEFSENRTGDITSGLAFQGEKLGGNVPLSTYEKLYEQSSVSSEGNLHVRLTETKDTLNPRGTGGAHSNCFSCNPEIIILKSHFERFCKNVTTKLDDLALEINVVKENKPYSIVTLEGIISELKEEKAELSRKNKELRENNNSMHKTISQLSQSKKQLEEEKSSLITAIKLIQNDFNQWHYIEKKASDNKIEDSANNIDRVNNNNAWIKPKHQTRQSTELSRDEDKPETSVAKVR